MPQWHAGSPSVADDHEGLWRTMGAMSHRHPRASTAFHGGIWRIGYRGGTIGMISAAYYYAKVHGIKVLAAVGGLVYLGRYLYTSSTTGNES